MSYRHDRRRPIAVARTVNWPAAAAAALAPVISAGLWLCLANALSLLGR